MLLTTFTRGELLQSTIIMVGDVSCYGLLVPVDVSCYRLLVPGGVRSYRLLVPGGDVSSYRLLVPGGEMLQTTIIREVSCYRLPLPWWVM